MTRIIRLRAACRTRLQAAACGAVLVAAAPALLGISVPSLDRHATGLLRELQFTPRDIAAVERGEPVARVLDTDTREIAVIGAVHIGASSERFVERFRTVDYLKGSRSVLAAGVLGIPPRGEDLEAVPFEEYDLDVRACRPGDCRVRLSADDIARFNREVQWQSAGWREQSARVWRSILGRYALEYIESGPSALPVYANKKEYLSVADESTLLRERTKSLAAYVPRVFDRLNRPVDGGARGGDEMLFWSVEDFGIRPVLRITHQVIQNRPSGGPALVAHAIATQQIYAAHYLDAALGFMVAVPGGPEGSSGFYLVSVNRARTRSLSGLLRRIVRSTVRGRSRDAMENILRATKRSLEQAPARSR